MVAPQIIIWGGKWDGVGVGWDWGGDGGGDGVGMGTGMGMGWTRGRDGDGTACPCCTVWSPLQLSVVEYDPGTHDLKTLSLHYFEEPELRVGVGLGAGDGSWGHRAAP